MKRCGHDHTQAPRRYRPVRRGDRGPGPHRHLRRRRLCGPADRAAAKKFATIAKSYGGKQQACKVLLPNGKQYKVFTRVVTGRQSFGVGLMVMLDGEVVRRVQTPITKPRRTSKVVSLKFPKGATEYELVASQFEGQSGGGGPVSVKKIRNC